MSRPKLTLLLLLTLLPMLWCKPTKRRKRIATIVESQTFVLRGITGYQVAVSSGKSEIVESIIGLSKRRKLILERHGYPEETYLIRSKSFNKTLCIERWNGKRGKVIAIGQHKELTHKCEWKMHCRPSTRSKDTCQFWVEKTDKKNRAIRFYLYTDRQNRIRRLRTRKEIHGKRGKDQKITFVRARLSNTELYSEIKESERRMGIGDILFGNGNSKNSKTRMGIGDMLFGDENSKRAHGESPPSSDRKTTLSRKHKIGKILFGVQTSLPQQKATRKPTTKQGDTKWTGENNVKDRPVTKSRSFVRMTTKKPS